MKLFLTSVLIILGLSTAHAETCTEEIKTLTKTQAQLVVTNLEKDMRTQLKSIFEQAGLTISDTDIQLSMRTTEAILIPNPNNPYGPTTYTTNFRVDPTLVTHEGKKRYYKLRHVQSKPYGTSAEFVLVSKGSLRYMYDVIGDTHGYECFVSGQLWTVPGTPLEQISNFTISRSTPENYVLAEIKNFNVPEVSLPLQN